MQDRATRQRPSTHAWPVPPVWLVWFAGAISLVGATTMIAGAIRIGVTVDETFHTVRLHNYLTHGWYLLNDDLTTTGTPGPWVEDRYVYGPVTTLLLHALNIATGNETWQTVSTTANAYLTRHLGITTIALTGTAAAATITRLLSGTWRWALITTAILLSLPMWTGHAMFNVKDIPVATGYTLFTLACIHTLTHHHTWKHHLTTTLLAYTGLLLALGTRPAIWPGLGATGLLLTLHLLATKSGLKPLTAPLTATALALTTLATLYPNLYANTTWILDSATESAGYRGTNSWSILPVAVLMTVPIVLLCLGAVGNLAGFAAWARNRDWSVRHAQVTMVASQALLLPTVIWIQAVPISGGLRHVLFAAPAIAILITLAIAKIILDLPNRGRQLASAVAALGMALPTVAAIQLFPYTYGYLNVLGSLAPPLPADDYRASMREAALTIPADAFVVCRPELDALDRPKRRVAYGGQSWLELGDNCTSNILAPYRNTSAPSPVAGSFIAVTITGPAAGCTELAPVTRHRLWQEVRIATVWRCPLVLPAYDGPIALDGAGAGVDTLLGGWHGTGGDAWITATDTASLGFHLPDDAGTQIALTGSATGTPTFLVNNEPVPVTATAEGWIVDLPADRPELGMPGNVVLTVVPAGGTVRLSGVEVTATR